MKPCKILIIEDDHGIREVFAKVLTLKGHDVSTANNGKEALDSLKGMDDAELPDCMLLDLMMPVMDGRTFLEHIERENRLSRIPILVTTALRVGPSTEALPLSPKILKKPLKLDTLLKEIEVVV